MHVLEKICLLADASQVPIHFDDLRSITFRFLSTRERPNSIFRRTALHCNCNTKALVFQCVPPCSDSYHANTEEDSPSRVAATKIERPHGRGTAVVPLEGGTAFAPLNPADVALSVGD